MTIKYTIDASVAAKWLLQESDSAQAVLFLDKDKYDLIAPDVIFSEVANALWKRVKSGQLNKGVATIFYKGFLKDTIISEHGISSSIFNQALEISYAIQHDTIYDCLYLALAIEQNAPLVSADVKFGKRLKDTFYAKYFCALQSFN